MAETPLTTEARATQDTNLGAVAEGQAASLRPGLIRRDLIRWGPIVGGIACVIATMAVLSSLGLAIGLSAIEADGTAFGDIPTGAWIWGTASAAIAFFAGGVIAGATAAVGGRANGALNGFMVGAASIAVIVAFAGFGVGNALGAAATALGQVVQVGHIGISGEEVVNSIARAEGTAWGTFIGLAVALILSALGGLGAARDAARDQPERR